MNLYDPDILDQLDPSLVDEFPAFLTHRSGIDKTLVTLIRAGIAHHVSSNAWSKILQELHVREHDLRELQYLHVAANIGDMQRVDAVTTRYGLPHYAYMTRWTCSFSFYLPCSSLTLCSIHTDNLVPLYNTTPLPLCP